MLTRFFDFLAGKPMAARSPQWAKLRDEFLREHPTCAACGSRDYIVPHHLMPVHLFPTLELDPANLLPLCEGTRQCHFRIGHAFSWRHFNRFAAQDAALQLKRIRSREPLGGLEECSQP